jgi:GNAT superfamily N-acetyltransferase
MSGALPDVAWVDGVTLAEAEVPLSWPTVDVASVERQQPDASLLVRGDDGLLRARASLWWSRIPRLEGARLGVIGHYGASDDVAAAAVIDAACERLRAEGCTLAAGPMDGTTWERYRFTTTVGGDPPFPFEPRQPASWPVQWQRAGFAPWHTYRSVVKSIGGRADPRIRERERTLAAAGVTIRAFEPARATEAIEAIHRVSVAAFAKAPLFVPISREQLVAEYAPFVDKITPGLVHLAYANEAPIGFVFAIPDWLEAARTHHAPSALILKTLAVLPGAEWRGLGRVLYARACEGAAARGATRTIHALIHDSNHASLDYGGIDARVIRRYALYARPIG